MYINKASLNASLSGNTIKFVCILYWSSQGTRKQVLFSFSLFLSHQWPSYTCDLKKFSGGIAHTLILIVTKLAANISYEPLKIMNFSFYVHLSHIGIISVNMFSLRPFSCSKFLLRMPIALVVTELSNRGFKSESLPFASCVTLECPYFLWGSASL